jgi:hypothetical protein
MNKFLKLHAQRTLSPLAREILGREIFTRSSGDERLLVLSAKARQAGLNMLEAYGDGRFPSEEDVLVFLDEAEPAHAEWLREQIKEAARIEREMQLESVYGFSED